MTKKYGENIQLLFTDTDSLMYEVCTNDFYQRMWAMMEEFDLASYPKSSQFYDPTIIKVIGKLEDEASAQSITEFVGLKPKMYSYQTLRYTHMERQGSEQIGEQRHRSGDFGYIAT